MTAEPRDDVDDGELARQAAAETAAEAVDGALLRRLLGQTELLLVFYDGDSYHAQVMTRDGVKRSGTHETVTELLRATLGETGPGRECMLCRIKYPPRLFSKDRSNADGLSRRCKLCERNRLKEYGHRAAKKRNAEAREARRQAEGTVKDATFNPPIKG